MGCTSGVFKCILNTLNTINALFGLLLIALATLSLGQAPTAYLIYLYAVGGILFVSSVIGCCGICQESVCLTMTYGVILLVILIVQLMGMFGLSFSEDAIKKFAADDVEQKWNQELVEPGAMNATQSTYHCCGRNGPDDYITIGRLTIPPSCYPDKKHGNLPNYTKGCIQAAAEEFLQIYHYASSSEWVILVFTAVMCSAAFYLVGRFRKERIRYHY